MQNHFVKTHTEVTTGPPGEIWNVCDWSVKASAHTGHLNQIISWLEPWPVMTSTRTTHISWAKSTMAYIDSYLHWLVCEIACNYVIEYFSCLMQVVKLYPRHTHGCNGLVADMLKWVISFNKLGRTRFHFRCNKYFTLVGLMSRPNIHLSCWLSHFCSGSWLHESTR